MAIQIIQNEQKNDEDIVQKFWSMFNLVTIPKDIFKFNTFIFFMALLYCAFAFRAQKGM
jgi:hypothetical protein